LPNCYRVQRVSSIGLQFRTSWMRDLRLAVISTAAQQHRHVRNWPEADILIAWANVRFQG
jgi:hypothetical protein